MRPIRLLLLAGAAAAAVAGVAMAAAKSPDVHVLRVPLPGGATEVIRYTGDVAPQISVSSEPMASGFIAPLIVDPMAYDWNARFAAFERLQAQMQRRADAMLRQARAMQSQMGSDPQQWIASGRSPGGGQDFSFVSTASGSGFCARSVQITSAGDGKAPKVVSRTYGNCGSGPSAPSVGATSAKDTPASTSEALPAKTGPGGQAAPAQAGRIGI